MKISIMQNKQKSLFKKFARWALVALFWLCIWHGMHLVVGHEVLLPSPLSTIRRLWQMLGDWEIYQAIGATLLRIMAGFLMGIVLGCAMGAASLFSKVAHSLFSPIITITKSTPFASFTILALLWFRTDMVPAVTATIMTLPIFFSSVYDGIRGVDKELLEMARLYQFQRMEILKLIILPGMRPALLTAMAAALGIAFKSGVAAEIICSPRYAIGSMLSDAKTYLETTDLFAVTAALIIISLLVERGMRRLLLWKS